MAEQLPKVALCWGTLMTFVRRPCTACGRAIMPGDDFVGQTKATPGGPRRFQRTDDRGWHPRCVPADIKARLGVAL